MYGDDVTITVAVASANVYYAVGSGLTGGELNLVTHANSTLTVTKAGRYLINWSAGVQCASANQNVSIAAMVNTTAKPETEGSTKLTTANDTKCVSGTGILSLAANDVVKLCAENETGANNITLTHATFTLVQVGG